MTKLEGFAGKNKDSTNDTSSNNSSMRANTPPMQAIANKHQKIKMGKGEIEQKKGDKPKIMPMGNDNGPKEQLH